MDNVQGRSPDARLRCGEVSGHEAVPVLMINHDFMYCEIILMHMIVNVVQSLDQGKVGSCDLTREQLSTTWR